MAVRRYGCTKGDGLIALEADDYPERAQSFMQVYGEKLGRRFSYGGTAGDRNVHMMTGRIQ